MALLFLKNLDVNKKKSKNAIFSFVEHLKSIPSYENKHKWGRVGGGLAANPDP